MSLPCMSRLKIHECVDIGMMKRKAPDGDHREGADAEPYERLPTSNKNYEELHSVSWAYEFGRLEKESLTEISVIMPKSGGGVWRIDFDLWRDDENARLAIATTDGEDVSMCFTALKTDHEFILDWGDLTEYIPSNCRITPKDAELWITRSAVLHVLDGIASQLRMDVSYLDYDIIYKTTMTRALVVTKGYGYYEGEGFCPRVLIDNIGSDTAAMLAARTVDLEWTRMVTTTPILHLPAAIREFYKIVDGQPDVAAFTRSMYDESALAKYADLAASVCADFETYLARVDERTRNTVTLRQMVTDDRGPTTRWPPDDKRHWVKMFMKKVWTRSIPAGADKQARAGRLYPGYDLVKSYWPDDKQALCSMVCKPSTDNSGTSVVVVALEPVRTDVKVKVKFLVRKDDEEGW